MSIESIEQRWSAATPGPWHLNTFIGSRTADICASLHASGMDVVAAVPRENVPEWEANVQALRNAPTDIAALLSVVKAAEMKHSGNRYYAGQPNTPYCSCGVGVDVCPVRAALAQLEAMP